MAHSLDGPYDETPRDQEGQADLERFFDDHLGASDKDGMDKENLPTNLRPTIVSMATDQMTQSVTNNNLSTSVKNKYLTPIEQEASQQQQQYQANDSPIHLNNDIKMKQHDDLLS